jgi:hypothetical protein
VGERRGTPGSSCVEVSSEIGYGFAKGEVAESAEGWGVLLFVDWG